MKQSLSINFSECGSCCCASYCSRAADCDASCTNHSRSTSPSTTDSNATARSISRTCRKGSGSVRLHHAEELEAFFCPGLGTTEESSSGNSTVGSSSTGNSSSKRGSSIKSNKESRNILSRALRHYWEVGTAFRWGCRRSTTIGVSCLFYLLPCIVLPISSGSSSISLRRVYESYMWGLVAVASFLSDFVFSGQRHNWKVRALHMTDRWLASFALMLQCLYNLPMWFSVSHFVGILGLVLLLCCCFLKSRSTSASSYDEYVWTHTAWHVVGAAARCVMACLEGH